MIERLADRPDGKLICVTGMTPTKAGEGKTTTLVGLTQGLGHIGKRPVACLREPSLGPVFGIKGGAAGGGMTQVVPMEDLNLHFTGDIHAIGAANNLLAAMLDASILHGNPHKIDALRVGWRRAMDMNDRALRKIAVGMGGRANGYPRESGFDITAASEVMAILAVSQRPAGPARAARPDHRRAVLRRRQADHGRGPRRGGRDGGAAQGRDQAEPDPDARGPAVPDALRPVREHRPRQQLARRRPGRDEDRRLRRDGVGLRLRHGHGEVLRHRLPLRRADGRAPSCSSPRCARSSTTAGSRTTRAWTARRRCARSRSGMANVRRHLGIIGEFGMPAVVAVNRRPGDTNEEVELVKRLALEAGAFGAEANEGFTKGGAGAADLAEAVVEACEQPNEFGRCTRTTSRSRTRSRRSPSGSTAPPTSTSIPRRRRSSRSSPPTGSSHFPVCMAKTHLSLSADPTLLNAPEHFTLAGARHPRLHRRRLARAAVRRHHADAGPRQDAGGAERRHRRGGQDGRPVLAVMG